MPERQTGRVVAVLIVVGLLATAAVLFALGRGRRDGAGSRGNPVVLILSPSHGDASVAARLGAALSTSSGLTIEVRSARTRAEAVAATGLASVDGGILPIFDYLLAHQEFGVRAGLQLVRGDGERATAGVILVRDDSPITALTQLAGQPIAFVDRSSTTGYLLAARLLQEQRIDVRPVFTGDHVASLSQLTAGTVAAAATYRHQRAGLRVIAAAGTVPNEPLFFHPRLPDATRDRILAAFVGLATTTDGRALLGQLAEATGVAPIDDAAYGEVNDLLAATRQRLVDLVPEGRRLVERRHQPVPPPMGQ